VLANYLGAYKEFFMLADKENSKIEKLPYYPPQICEELELVFPEEVWGKETGAWCHICTGCNCG